MCPNFSEHTRIETKDVFCHTCNVLVEARVVATHIEPTIVEGYEHYDPEDTHHLNYVYSMLICGRCKSVFLVESKYYEIPAEACLPQEERVLYPQDTNFDTEGISENITGAYLKAAQSFKTGLYEPCVIMCRKCLEAVCKELGVTKGNLKQRLNVLKDKELIDQKLFSWAEQLRSIGNIATHEFDFEVEKEDAFDAMQFVEAIIMYTFSLNRRFDQFKKRNDSKQDKS